MKSVFRWAVEQELLPGDVYHAIAAVKGLARGRTKARENQPVEPAPEAFIEAIKNHVAPEVWAMVQVQLFTGARPGEVVIMRTCAFSDTGEKVWSYSPRPTRANGARIGGRSASAP